jgi:hypothetical protein
MASYLQRCRTWMRAKRAHSAARVVSLIEKR